MAYKVCGPAPNCAGDIELSIEDAASPFTLVAEGNPGPMPRPKPIADVINLSLGDTGGDPAGTTSRACNNAALAGTIVVASAGNSVLAQERSVRRQRLLWRSPWQRVSTRFCRRLRRP
jgi:subtilisin family serine protease